MARRYTVGMDYEQLRQSYLPQTINVLFIAESPPPESSAKPTTRAFYSLASAGEGDRLFNNTMRALYPEDAEGNLENLAKNKEEFLRRFQADGFYMIEALTQSLIPGTKTSERIRHLKDSLPELLKRVEGLATPETKIVLIKSNPFKVCAEPLRAAGYNVLNQETLNYPGYWQEKHYRDKLKILLSTN